jgi:hypothetical protein
MLGDEMIDEASRKLAMVATARDRAAGLARTRAFRPPGQALPARPSWPGHRVSPALPTI